MTAHAKAGAALDASNGNGNGKDHVQIAGVHLPRKATFLMLVSVITASVSIATFVKSIEHRLQAMEALLKEQARSSWTITDQLIWANSLRDRNMKNDLYVPPVTMPNRGGEEPR